MQLLASIISLYILTNVDEIYEINCLILNFTLCCLKLSKNWVVLIFHENIHIYFIILCDLKNTHAHDESLPSSIYGASINM